LHEPNSGKNSFGVFDSIIKQRIAAGVLNFQAVFFPDTFIITKKSHGVIAAEMDFKFAVFNKEVLFFNDFEENINFGSCEFRRGAQFSSASFKKSVFFHYAKLDGYFSFGNVGLPVGSGLWFNLSSSTKECRIHFGVLSEIGGKIAFDSANVGGSLQFDNTFDQRTGKDIKDTQLLSIKDAAIDHPERVRFHDCLLDANWFLNIDSRKFSFANVEWRPVGKINPSAHTEKIYRNLATNAEESDDYRHASFFRNLAMECARKRKTLPMFFNIHWWYKWTSGYGESWFWAAFGLVGLLVAFSFFYNSPFASFERDKSDPSIAAVAGYERTVRMNDLEGIVYSLNVGLQNVEPKPADSQTKLFVIFERILAPIQAALLALAIRRKFMR
jgi:hypothetical protein